MKTLYPTREQLAEAQAVLKDRGWSHVATVIADKSTQGQGYGLLYARCRDRFWLNKDTINDLPK